MDTRVDRRAFLQRASALAAAVTVGTVALPAVAYAGPTAPASLQDITTPVRPEALADLTELTIAEAATLIRHRPPEARKAPRGLPGPNRQLRATYQAFNRVLADQALAAAKAARAIARRRPARHPPRYQGQLLDRAACRRPPTPTSSRSSSRRTTRPRWPGSRPAGAIVLGKTQMGPLATTRATTPGRRITTVNAWTPADPRHVDPGGSSTGIGHVRRRPAGDVRATGTQTGGSIIAPANAQNLTGLKPTMGRVSLPASSRSATPATIPARSPGTPRTPPSC